MVPNHSTQQLYKNKDEKSVDNKSRLEIGAITNITSRGILHTNDKFRSLLQYVTENFVNKKNIKNS